MINLISSNCSIKTYQHLRCLLENLIEKKELFYCLRNKMHSLTRKKRKKIL